MPNIGAATPRILAVIPTYNEADNIARLIPAVLKQAQGMHVLIVDDNSPDGTAKIVHELMLSDERIRILERPAKAGLGGPGPRLPLCGRRPHPQLADQKAPPELRRKRVH